MLYLVSEAAEEEGLGEAAGEQGAEQCEVAEDHHANFGSHQKHHWRAAKHIYPIEYMYEAQSERLVHVF